jgi:hypothetical protein
MSLFLLLSYQNCLLVDQETLLTLKRDVAVPLFQWSGGGVGGGQSRSYWMASPSLVWLCDPLPVFPSHFLPEGQHEELCHW